MRRKFNKLLSLTLAVILCLSMAEPAFAFGGWSGANWTSNWIWSWWQNGSKKSDTGSDNTASDDTSLTLVEDETTVEDGTELRASTYAMTSGTSRTSGNSGNARTTATTTLKYFPVTLYDYDTTTINNATHQVEVNKGLGSTWNGIYFSNGSPAAESYTSSSVSIEAGTYIIRNARAEANYVTKSYLQVSGSSIVGANKNNATQWTLSVNSDGTYTLQSGNSYLTIGNGTSNTKVQTSKSTVEIVAYSGDYSNAFQIKSGSYYLNQYGSNISTSYGGYNVNNDAGNAFYLYKVDGNTTTQVKGSTATASLSYAAWNWWNKNTNNNKYGQYTYSGLVNSTLDANKNISFTKPDGGIFNSDATVKTIYTGVEMPFVYENGTYTFDASQNGVYFYADGEQDSTAAQSNGRLYFNEGNPQKNNTDYADGSSTVWMPFNSTQNISGEGNCNYHFGMAATIPFTMTANGKMNPNDDNSEDITFSFSGDDDVWVFIDGQLVLDIGGIHNRLDATINFAENTWELSANNSAKDSNQNAIPLKDYNNAAISGKLFNEGNTTGTLNQTRETFAATDSHELTIFYLERGAGSSNCKIQFNLPMKDTVTVKKVANQSMTSDGTVSDLTAEEQAMVNNTEFGFTIYKDGAPLANTSYSQLNENGQVISVPSTDSAGHFYLKAGESAKFVGEIDSSTYYVVEDENTSFQTPSYAYTAEVANGASETSEANGWTSMQVQATGSEESEDSIIFTCTNYLDAELPNPTAQPQDDKIVIDYGLPVVIDVLKNDISKGNYTLTSVTEEGTYGSAKMNEDGTITYQLTKQLTGVEVLTYTATASNGEQTAPGTAKVYIIPATSMYYEENFSDLVNFSNGWTDVGTAQTDPQEPGVVGTVADSPYGSDAAYLNDSRDSNGSSKYVSTSAAQASFSYRFTGTGTSFFARTGSDTAYMRVVVQDENGNTVSDTRRNNIYQSVDGTNVGTLYNIPVYTNDGLNYGTYTVTVSLMKANADLDRGSEFYLDGIRVINPLDSTDANASVATAAYATDGEANMTVATLRQKLLKDAAIEEEVTDEDGNTTTQLTWDGTNFVVFTDTNGAITSAEEYKSNGPKEEVYLNNGQSVTFSLDDWDANTNKIYLGVKAPTGSGSVSINGNSLSINNAADCYYDISSYADISTVDGVKIATFEVEATSSLISVTNIKVTGNAEFTIVNNTDIDVDEDGNEIEALALDDDENDVEPPAEPEVPAAEEPDAEPEAPVDDGAVVDEPGEPDEAETPDDDSETPDEPGTPAEPGTPDASGTPEEPEETAGASDAEESPDGNSSDEDGEQPQA